MLVVINFMDIRVLYQSILELLYFCIHREIGECHSESLLLFVSLALEFFNQ